MKNYLGIDEAGRGPVLGPIVMVGFYGKLSFPIKDSKKYSPKKRQELFRILIKQPFEIRILSAHKISKLMSKMSLNEIEQMLTKDLILRSKQDNVVIDCPSINVQSYKEYFSSLNKNIVCLHKADEKYPNAAAASIIAKVVRDNIIEKYKQKLSCEIGSGYTSDKKTVSYIKSPKHEIGIIRTSWKTYNQTNLLQFNKE